MNKNIKLVRVYKDERIPAFGGWAAGSMKDNEPTILLNVAACLLPCVTEDETEVVATVEEKKWLLITTLMHEFGHALQEFFDLEFTEERLENLVQEYEKFHLPSPTAEAAALNPAQCQFKSDGGY